MAEVSEPNPPGAGAVAPPGLEPPPDAGAADVAVLTRLANELLAGAYGPVEGASAAPAVAGHATPVIPGAPFVPASPAIPASAPGGTPDLPVASGPGWGEGGFSAGSWPVGPIAGGLGTLPGIPTLPRSPFETPEPALGGFGPGPSLSAHAPWLPSSGLPSSAPVGAPEPPRQAAGAPAPVEAPAPSFSPRLEALAAPGPSAVPKVAGTADVFDAASIRRQFPILRERVHGRPLVWLDNGATTQKPQAVIDRLVQYYEHENSNVHRGAHTLAARATDAYEAARDKVRRFLNASSASEIVFTRGTTEAINLVAQAWGRRYVEAGDEIVVTWLEHHANIVPWQQLAAEKGARLRAAPIDDRGVVQLDEYEKLLNSRTKIVAITHVSNAIGTINPIREMTALAHRHGAVVLIDGAQSVAHLPVDVQAIGADFFVFSGHKVYAPTGIGGLWGRKDVLEATPPWQGGGSMIVDVTFERTVYHGPPARFEAGTGNIADAVGLGEALDWLSAIGLDAVRRHEVALIDYAVEQLCTVPGLCLLGDPPERAGALSFTLEGFTSEEVGKALDREGIAVRSGHHCAQPVLRRLGVETSVRPSFGVYNTDSDIDALRDALLRLRATR